MGLPTKIWVQLVSNLQKNRVNLDFFTIANCGTQISVGNTMFFNLGKFRFYLNLFPKYPKMHSVLVVLFKISQFYA